MIHWAKNFETGFEPVDRQHQMLIRNINHLEAQLGSTNPNKVEYQFLMHLVDFLETYAEAHFKLEEQCMECNRCPVQAANRTAHANYRAIFSGYKKQCEIHGFTWEICRQLHAAASLWVGEHILKIDTQLRPCLPDNPPPALKA